MLKYIFLFSMVNTGGRGSRRKLCKANVMKTLVLLKRSMYVSLYLTNFDCTCSYGTMQQFITTRVFYCRM